MSAAIDAALNRLKEADKVAVAASAAWTGEQRTKVGRATGLACFRADDKKKQAVEALCDLLNPGLCDDRDDGRDV
jgi:hypothetical protein